MGLCGLHSHCKQYHFISDETCLKCHVKKEDNLHFQLKCLTYAAQRTEMIAYLSIAPLLQIQMLPTKANASLHYKSQLLIVYMHHSPCGNPPVDISEQLAAHYVLIVV